MLQKIILAIAIFIIILVALTFGETVAHEAFAWISRLTGLVINNFSDVYYAVKDYLAAYSAKAALSLALTVSSSLLIIKAKSGVLQMPANPRIIAIVLAVFLGWLGALRFYLGQIGWGVFYLIIFYLFAPLVIVLALIDAVRYMFMSDEEFALARI